MMKSFVEDSIAEGVSYVILSDDIIKSEGASFSGSYDESFLLGHII